MLTTPFNKTFRITSGIFTMLSLIAFFLFVILLPSSFVLLFLVSKRAEVSALLSSTESMALILNALFFSLRIAAFVSFVNLVFGFPLAWLLARTQIPGRRFFENLTSLPLALPTSALGFSAAMFWAYTKIPLSAFWFISLVHLAFTFPFVVGVLSTALYKNTASLESAATILGAPKLSVIRTIVLPQVKLELFTSILFSFARSLSETGATVVALTVFGITQPTAPALIAQLGTSSDSQIPFQDKMLLAAVISGILIIISFLIFWLLRSVIMRKGISLFPRLIRLEGRVNIPAFRKVKNFIIFAFLFVIVLIPPFFIIGRVLGVRFINYNSLASSLTNSVGIALFVTLINLIFGTPMAYYIVRFPSQRIRKLIHFLIDIPLIVPTVALGFSLGLYWRLQGFITSDFLLIVLAHLAFTYPYMVRTLHDGFAGLRQEFVDASRSLGASPFKVFRTLVLPILAPSFLTAIILVLTRSLGETGATMAVTQKVLTAPVYIVDLVKTDQLEQAGVVSAVLIILSFFAFTLFRKVALLHR